MRLALHPPTTPPLLAADSNSLENRQESPRPLPQSTAVDLRQGSTLRTSASIDCQVRGPLLLVEFSLAAVAPDLLALLPSDVHPPTSSSRSAFRA
ncbi:hypothetical protein K488DRAFT_92639 [Vararia minispora EC-137]|uniref:Uncharacterized protein n=1 Tax=Vararia minispora EC-137 TaxID=1314806 RepID=A0ACB8Q490_9AGAM|nr:hypothetical protein K488DRAFT_92639 [Vararia minispora EC-137]